MYQAFDPPYHLWHDFFPALQAAALSAAQTANTSLVGQSGLGRLDVRLLVDSRGTATGDTQLRCAP